MFLFSLIQAVFFLTTNGEVINEEDQLVGFDGKRSGHEDTTRSQLVALKRKLKQELAAVKSEVDSMNRTILSLKSGFSRKDVNFEVTTSHHVTMQPYQTYKFDTVVLNNGGGYHAPTGIFEAPVSGTYLFWGNVHHTESSAHLILYKEGQHLATSADHVHGGECNLVYLAEVRKGEKLWFGSAGNVAVIYGSKHGSYGGVLIHAH